MFDSIKNIIKNTYFSLESIFFKKTDKIVLSYSAALSTSIFSLFTFLNSLSYFKGEARPTVGYIIHSYCAFVSIITSLISLIIYFQLRNHGKTNKVLKLSFIISTIFLIISSLYNTQSFGSTLMAVYILLFLSISIFMGDVSISLIPLIIVVDFFAFFNIDSITSSIENGFGLFPYLDLTLMTSVSQFLMTIVFLIIYLIESMIPSKYQNEQKKTEIKKKISLLNHRKDLLFSRKAQFDKIIQSNSTTIDQINNMLHQLKNSIYNTKLSTPELIGVLDKYQKIIRSNMKSFKTSPLYPPEKEKVSFFLGRLETFLKINMNPEKDFTDSLQSIQKVLKGFEGEKRVKDMLSSMDGLTFLDSINLPYNYGNNSSTNDNQIDIIIINKKGIFPLEIKDYNIKFRNYKNIFYINSNGFLEVKSNNNENEPYVFNKGQSIQIQMDRHKIALENLFTKITGSSELSQFIYPVCVIANNDPSILVKDTPENSYRLTNINNLYSKVLDNPNLPNIFKDKDIQIAKEYILKANLAERKYPYILLNEITPEMVNMLLKNDEIYTTPISEYESKIGDANKEIEKISNEISLIQDKIEKNKSKL